MAARAKRKSSAGSRPSRSRSTRNSARRRTATKRSGGQAQSGFSFGVIARKLGDAAKEMVQKATQQPAANDAIQLLEQDHREVEQMLEQFEQASDNGMKSEIADKICLALTVHTEIEEKIFYPRARKQIEEEDLLDEAEVEHASAKQLIAQIQKMTPRDRLFDAKVKVLGEYVKHHVKEEENELFPQARDSGMNLEKVGEELREEKMALLKKASKKA